MTKLLDDAAKEEDLTVDHILLDASILALLADSRAAGRLGLWHFGFRGTIHHDCPVASIFMAEMPVVRVETPCSTIFLYQAEPTIRAWGG